MPDLLIRDLPADVLEKYTEKARAAGTPLARYITDVLQGKQPTVRPVVLTRDELVQLTERNLARFPKVLPTMPRRDMREGMEWF